MRELSTPPVDNLMTAELFIDKGVWELTFFDTVAVAE